MKYRNQIFAKSISLVVLLFVPAGALFAQSGQGNPPCTGNNCFSNPLKFESLADFLNALLNVIIIIGIPVVTLAIIFAGFLFITAQGNETKVSTAKNIFFWVVIGALLILGAKALAVAIEGTVKDLTEAPKSQELTLEENSEIYDLIKGSV